MVLKQVMVRHLTNFWSLMTKSTTFLIILTLKRKNEIEIVKNKTCAAFNPKRASGLKTSYGETFDKLFVFFHQKYDFLENLDSKTQNRD